MFYVAHRLFAAHDRALGALAARRLAVAVGAHNVFLPFCDTDEEDLVADVKGRMLFDLDTARLQQLSGMLAILHGPSLDDGVCLEIGYAAALGAPIVVVTTDFTTWALTEHEPELAFPDPLIEAIAGAVVRVPKLRPAPGNNTEDLYLGFSARNTAQLGHAVDNAVDRLLDLAQAAAPSSAPVPRPRGDLVFCEPSPYLPSSDWQPITERLRTYGYQPVTSTRLNAHPALKAVRAAAQDWVTAMAASVLVADVNGPETPPGAALLAGAFTALERPIHARHHRPVWSLASGREPNRRNLMIQYAIRHWFTDHPDLAPRSCL